MSVNIYDGTNLIPIAGKTVPMPTPDYVDEQYNSTTTYSKGMTCISGNKRYRYINSTASSRHQPPNATYWEELSVNTQLKTTYHSGNNLTFSDCSYVKGGWYEQGDLVIVNLRITTTQANTVLYVDGLPNVNFPNDVYFIFMAQAGIVGGSNVTPLSGYIQPNTQNKDVAGLRIYANYPSMPSGTQVDISCTYVKKL